MTVTTGPAANPPRRDGSRLPSRPPRREELAGATVEVMLRGGPYKADLLRVDVGEGPMVVKDFAGKPALSRLFGRLLIRRELAAYRWLGAMDGIVRPIGRVDAHALALEWVEALVLGNIGPRKMPAPPQVLFERLQRLVARLHARGFLHLDLRGRENVLVRPDGSLVVIDLAASVHLRPGGLAHRLAFPVLARFDRAGVIKWKEILTGRLTDEERAFKRRFLGLRWFWRVNRKGLGREDPDPP